MSAYAAVAHAEELRAQRRGETLVIPSASVIANRFGSWPDALEAGGVATAAELRTRRRGDTRAKSDREVLESLATAVKKLGPQLTIGEYTDFRETRRRPDGRVPLASEALIRQRFGTWKACIAEASEHLAESRTKTRTRVRARAGTAAKGRRR
jgi:hypothetical protein